jgi:hypothetical protein
MIARKHMKRHQLRKVCLSKREKCGVMIARKHMKRHQLRKVCLSKREKWLISEENPANQEQQPPKPEPMTGPPMPQEYCVLIDKTCKVDCPVADCPGTYSTGRAM